MISYSKIAQLIKFSILSLATRQDTRKFPSSTAVPVLTFLSMHRITVPNVANNDAEDINAKHSNFKTMFRDKTKTPQLVLYLAVILYLVTSCPVKILLNNVKQNLQSSQLHRWATTDGAPGGLHCVHGNSLLSRNFESLWRNYAALSRDYALPFRGII